MNGLERLQNLTILKDRKNQWANVRTGMVGYLTSSLLLL